MQIIHRPLRLLGMGGEETDMTEGHQDTTYQ